MRVLIKIILSILLIVTSLIFLWIISSQSLLLGYAGSFVLGIGSVLSFILGFCFLFLVLAQLKRGEKPWTEDYISKKIEEELYKVGPHEDKIIFKCGEIASNLKKRGIEEGTLTSRGTYIAYEAWIRGIKKAAELFLKKYPNQKSYLIGLLAKIDEVVYPQDFDKILENFAKFTEEYKKLGFDYFPSQALKRLANIIEMYARRKHRENS
ncbi:MAG: hypothetical protein QXQ77_01810 [Candidatus Aenigmatarchaeota archaeon]